MAITTRQGKGSALTHAELDTNFTDLNSVLDNKLDKAGGTLTGDLNINGNVIVSGTVGASGFSDSYVDLGAFNGNLLIDPAFSSVFELIVTNDIVFDGFSSPQPGQFITIVAQNTYSFVPFTWTDSVNAVYSKGISSFTNQGNVTDIIGIFYSGSKYYITFNKGFQ